jgi:hypothetical protein
VRTERRLLVRGRAGQIAYSRADAAARTCRGLSLPDLPARGGANGHPLNRSRTFSYCGRVASAWLKVIEAIHDHRN